MARTVTDKGVEVLLEYGLGTPRGDLGQAGVTLDLDAPTLVLGEVPVETVDLVAGEMVDVLLHEVRPEEVPAHVEMHAPVGKAGRVVDEHRGDPEPTTVSGTVRW